MIRPIVRDVLFLRQKSEPAGREDLPVGIDLMDTLQLSVPPLVNRMDTVMNNVSGMMDDVSGMMKDLRPLPGKVDGLMGKLEGTVGTDPGQRGRADGRHIQHVDRQPEHA